MSMAVYTTYSDTQLFVLLQDGDSDAFTEIYGRHYNDVYRFIHRYLKCPHLSADVCQSVFVKLWELRNLDRPILDPVSYIFTVAKRKAFDFLKRAATEQAAMGIILQRIQPRMSVVEDEFRYREYIQFIDDIFSKLPEQSKIVFKLCRQENKTYEETAQLLGISRNTVKKHMVRSMKILKHAAESDLGISLCALLAVIASKA